jgi:DNA-directed RNA polymerase subunit RPC12/RpoP
MAVCPKCKKVIDTLINWVSGENKYYYRGEDCTEFEEFVEDGKTNDYECPECSAVLFKNDEKAKKFLKGG